jgi:Dynamin family
MLKSAYESQTAQRLESLHTHLLAENPALLGVVNSFRALDDVARRIGFFDRSQSFTTHIAWWPIMAVLGTYSSGKSTFINDYLGQKLQLTGNQAVDDKFTVLCYSMEGRVRVLPGLALDADPRFPFFKVSDAIERVTPGEGRRIDAYLQLKTCSAEELRGKIFIDSPGFDADAQRTSTLRLTDYIVDLSDLVLVFFDARHPESGTMQDTLQHLVADTIARPDSNKFLYILNQIDSTVLEDNPEDVVASWQRALAQKGLTAGRFYRIYSPSAAIPIPDPKLKARFESKRDADLADIHGRIRQVEVERAYRIVGMLEKTAHSIREKIIPNLEGLIRRWRTRVLILDAVLAVVLVLAIIGAWPATDTFVAPLWQNGAARIAIAAAVAGLLLYLHYRLRRLAAKQVIAKLRHEIHDKDLLEHYIRAFLKNTRWYRSIFHKRPAGWSGRTSQQIKGVLLDAGRFVQELNDRFTNPSGGTASALQPRPATIVPDERGPTGTSVAPEVREPGTESREQPARNVAS